MVQSPIFMYIFIWVFVSSLIVILLYGVMQFSKRRITKTGHEARVDEAWVVRQSARSPLDRRSGVDRRKAHNLDHFLSGGTERRSWKERRSKPERRKEWVRVDEWVSALVSDLESDIAAIKRDM